jgi:hypothetical protein
MKQKYDTYGNLFSVNVEFFFFSFFFFFFRMAFQQIFSGCTAAYRLIVQPYSITLAQFQQPCASYEEAVVLY